MGRRRRIGISLLSAALFLMPIASSSAETLVVTVDGEEYAGEVILAGVNTLTMKLQGSGYQIIPLQSISRMQIDIVNGTSIEGTFLDWSNGEIFVRVGDRDVAVRDGIITSVSTVGVAAGGPSEPEPLPPAEPLPQAEPTTPESPDSDDVPSNATM